MRALLKQLDLDSIKEPLLTPRQRQIVEYYVDQSLSLEKTAERMGLSLPEVRHGLYAVRRIALGFQDYTASGQDEKITVTLEKGEWGMIAEAVGHTLSLVRSAYDTRSFPDGREEMGFDARKLEMLVEKLRAVEHGGQNGQ